MDNPVPSLPWVMFPNYGFPSMGWRMGPGQDVYEAFFSWFESLNDTEAAAFAQHNPEPPEWSGWYQRVRNDNWD
ncbi:MAG: hypothetical protein B7Y43_16215 [Sphingomonas sp. 28-62-20]|nr:MAG: hypothetical protein B7Y43_16215 [Sphingomonas sp. 28-62-20]